MPSVRTYRIRLLEQSPLPVCYHFACKMELTLLTTSLTKRTQASDQGLVNRGIILPAIHSMIPSVAGIVNDKKCFTAEQKAFIEAAGTSISHRIATDPNCGIKIDANGSVTCRRLHRIFVALLLTATCVSGRPSCRASAGDSSQRQYQNATGLLSLDCCWRSIQYSSRRNLFSSSSSSLEFVFVSSSCWRLTLIVI